MTFREKGLVANITGLMLTYGAYIAWSLAAPRSLFAVAQALSAVIAVQVALTVGANLIFSMQRSPEVQDERDRLFELRGLRAGYYVFAAGIVCVFLMIFRTNNFVKILNALLAVLVIAEIVRYSAQLVSYRRS